tara:strand:- start:108 stop:509 length:402 start_codon:yes stop_codon:yes gene_type:complete
MSSPTTHGANALKLENEIITEQATNSLTSEMLNEQTTNNQEVERAIEENQSDNYEQSFSEEAIITTNETVGNNSIEEEQVSNGLENFGVEGETGPDLFTSDNETDGLLSTENNEKVSEDDDLEIPAFLRRQKN